MTDEDRVRISKHLSYHLRHRPDELGLTLAPGGWVEVAALLAACAQRGFLITEEALAAVVASDEKGRFSLDRSGESGGRIRANQGHSTQVDLQLAPVPPPERLYHGTATRFAAEIERAGLVRKSRHHVHLSVDMQTARAVGSRHGKPVIFAVDAGQMARDGLLFYCSANGVWLTDEVPPRYLRRC